MQDTAPTSTATSGNTEPEIVAGIASAEGQPGGYIFDVNPPLDLRPLGIVGAAMAFGLIAALGYGAMRPRG